MDNYTIGDRAGRLYSVQHKIQVKTVIYTYYANRNRESIIYTDDTHNCKISTTESYTYYKNNKVNTVEYKKLNTKLQSYLYTYNAQK